MKKFPLFLLLLPFLLLACSHQEAQEGAYPMIAQADKAYQEEEPKQDDGKQDAVVKTARKLIKTGSLAFETGNLQESYSSTQSVVEKYDAYINSESQSNYSGRREQRMVIRVPSQHFDKLLEEIAAGARQIDSRQVDVMDVTAEYLDVETRIRTKKDLEKRYTELLSQARNVEEILAIERQLGEIRTEIESAEGRLKYLSDQVNYSTLTVTFYEQVGDAPGFARHFGQGLSNGWENLLWFFVGLVNIWPFLLLGALALWLLRRYWRRRK